MEYTQTLVHPESVDRHLGVTVEPVEHVDTLNDLRDVSQVEDVVRLLRCWQEGLRDSSEEIQRRLRDGLSKRLDLFLKLLELVVQNRLEDPADLCVSREGEVY